MKFFSMVFMQLCEYLISQNKRFSHSNSNFSIILTCANLFFKFTIVCFSNGSEINKHNCIFTREKPLNFLHRKKKTFATKNELKWIQESRKYSFKKTNLIDMLLFSSTDVATGDKRGDQITMSNSLF